VLQQARERLEAGLPPTDDAEMEWLALVRQEQTLEDLKAQREQVKGLWVDCTAGCA
jgi:gluconate kinase